MTAYVPKSKSDDWSTPPDFYDKLNQEFGFDFDPCPLRPESDGLSIPWGQRNFCNPPYSQLKLWLRKGYEESLLGKLVVFLIPSRTDTIAWHSYVVKADEVRFVKGRLRFGGCPNPAPFASAVVIFRGHSE